MKIDDESKKRIERRERERKRGQKALYMKRGEERKVKISTLSVAHYYCLAYDEKRQEK